MNEKTPRIPDPVVQRLTQYMAHIRGLREDGQEWVSSEGIAESLGLTSSTVRQDLSHLDFSGISNRGYQTEGLEDVLLRELGADKTIHTIIVGAGNLGRALATHGELERRNFAVTAIFDSDPRITGQKIGPLRVQDMEGIQKAVKSMHVDIAIVAVPATSAQEVSDVLVTAGIRGILNMTPAHVAVPDTVAVVDARIVASLQELSYRMRVKANA